MAILIIEQKKENSEGVFKKVKIKIIEKKNEIKFRKEGPRPQTYHRQG